MEIINLPDKELKVMVQRMLTEHEKWMNTEELQQRDRKQKKYQIEITELNNTITELKNVVEGGQQQAG